jgi:transposase-like protein
MTCSNCGSVYNVRKVKIIMRDKDVYNCDVCGQELMSWNGGVMYYITLVEKKENHKKRIDESVAGLGGLKPKGNTKNNGGGKKTNNL